jgi:hypothetical protein
VIDLLFPSVSFFPLAHEFVHTSPVSFYLSPYVVSLCLFLCFRDAIPPILRFNALPVPHDHP